MYCEISKGYVIIMIFSINPIANFCGIPGKHGDLGPER